MGGVCIVEDSRQRAGKHAGKHEYWAAHGIPFLPRKRALPYGDYMRGYADGSLDETLKVSIETKASVAELASNLGKKMRRESFLHEIQRANDAGCELVVLVEDSGVARVDDLRGWANPRCSHCFQYGLGCDPRSGGICPELGTMPPMQGPALAAQIASIQRDWDASFELLARPEDTARRICELLGVPC